MKKLLLASSMLLSLPALAAMTVDAKVTIKGNEYSKTFAIEDGQSVEFNGEDGTVIRAQFQDLGENVEVQAQVFVKDEDGEDKLISAPTLKGDWDKEMVVTIGSNEGEELSISATAHKN